MKIFFEDTNKYLRNSYGIAFRKDIVQRYVAKMTSSNILDIGCGDASLSKPLLGTDNFLTLIDLSENMLEKASRRFSKVELNRVNFICGDFENEGLEEGKFDLILAIGILAHVPSVGNAISKISSLIRPGGRLIVQFTDESHFLSRITSAVRTARNRTRYHVNKTTFDEVAKLLEDNRFVVDRIDRYSFLIPGFGILGSKILYGYTSLLHRLSRGRIGTDVILLARKI